MPEEVAVELMSEDDFDKALFMVYEIGDFEPGMDFGETIQAIKKELGLFEKRGER